MKIAIYPGSFDPITLGHLNIIERASKIFDEVIVCVMANSDKHPIFSAEERVDFVTRATRHLSNVKADLHNPLRCLLITESLLRCFGLKTPSRLCGFRQRSGSALYAVFYALQLDGRSRN